MKALRTIIAAAAIAGVASAWAIPARPGTFKYVQPDGTEIELRKVGDEFGHYYLTDDKQMALKSGDAFYFAQVGADGMLVPSAVLASNQAQRTSEQMSYLSKVNPTALANAAEATRQADPRLKMRQADMPMRMAPMQAASSNPSACVGRVSTSIFPTTGEVTGCVILVEYQDVPFTQSDEETHEYYTAMLNEPGFSRDDAIGSAWDYFNDASSGKFNPTFDVLGPVKLPYNREYYGTNTPYRDCNAYLMVEHAADWLVEQGVDFSKYDNDGDGIVENIFVFYAGEGEAARAGNEDTVWPHQLSLSQLHYPQKGYRVGNVWLDNYACGCELLEPDLRDGIGTFCHEFSHVLGLPDLYDTSNDGDYTPDHYDIMSKGPYNGNSRIPPTYSAFERNALGWIDLEVIDGPMDISLSNLCTTNKGYIVLSSKPEEFFLLENRQKLKNTWDQEIPGHGMLIWHIQYNAQRWNKNIVNTIGTHQYVDIIEAAGRIGTNPTVLKTYPFPGTAKKKAFDGFTTYAGEQLGYPLSDISEVIYGDVKFKVSGGAEAGIESVDGEAQLQVNGREISSASAMDVYDVYGRVVCQGQNSAKVASAGLYIVKVEGTTHKIVVN